MQLSPFIRDLAILLAVAGLMMMIFKIIKQPVVLGYILAGLVIGPHIPVFHLVRETDRIIAWAQLGVIFLMFGMGLEFSFRKLMKVGLTAMVTATLEVIFFLTFGYGLGKMFGWSDMQSLFLGAMLSISSTTIIIKSLEELKLKHHHFAKVIFGILIVEDLMAILLIVGLKKIATSDSYSLMSLMGTAMLLILVVGSWFIVGHFIVPRVMSFVTRKGSNEMLTLISAGLCLMLVLIASNFGYSSALGAFIMGSILAETKVSHQIESVMAPLKDFFGAIFFVSVGMFIDPYALWHYRETIAILCLATILGKIFINGLGALISGEGLRSSLRVGMGMAQIGEFSFILAGVGINVKVIKPDIFSIIVAVSFVTTFTTPYFIKLSEKLAGNVENWLPESINRALHEYHLFWHGKTNVSKEQKIIGMMISKWLIYGFFVAVVFYNIMKYLVMGFKSQFPLFNFSVTDVSWILTMLLATPFIWGMVSMSKRRCVIIKINKLARPVALAFILPVLTAVYITMLSFKYVPFSLIIPTVLLLLVATWVTQYKRMQKYSRWYDDRYVFSKNKIDSQEEKMMRLSPWDIKFNQLQVHPNSGMVGRTLREIDLMKRFGINLVAIKRGIKIYKDPAENEMIYPMDTLMFISNQKQMLAVRKELNIPFVMKERHPLEHEYLMQHLQLNDQSPIVGKSMIDAPIKEINQLQLVGLERDNKRIVNPPQDLTFVPGDVMWLVGDKRHLDGVIPQIL